MKPEFLGEWHLNAYAYVDTHIGPGDPPAPVDIEDWLFAAAGVGWPELEARTGLELVIRHDGSYSERVVGGELPMLWYESEGVQVDAPEPTEGTVRDVDGRDGASLHPHSAPAPEIRTEEGLRGVLRYDDGDTQVSDILRVAGDSLVRAISVVTDEIYFNRIVARYGRLSNVSPHASAEPARGGPGR
jgi:hypothetical protein